MVCRAITICAAAVSLVALAGCPKKPANGWQPGDGHDDSSDVVRRVPPMTAGEAAARLAETLPQSQADAVIYANRVVAGGGEVSTDDRAAVDSLIDRLTGSELETMWPELEAGSWPSARVALRLALIANHTGDPAAAASWLDKVEGGGDISRRAQVLERELRAKATVDRRSIGVVLPLSGNFRQLGEEMRAGIEMAANVDGRVELHFFDTGGEADGAVAAVERAVFDEHVVALIGPVGQAEAVAAARRASELGVPIALLAPADSGGSPADGVFRLWPSPGWQGREAARLAVELGFDALAVFAPRDDYGAAHAEAFAAEATKLGVRVVANGRYDPTASDLEPDIKTFLGLDPMTNERLRRHLRKYTPKIGWKTFSPDIPFDLLYIPDDHDRAALVASYLPFFNVEVRTSDLMDTSRLRRKHGGRLPSVVQLMGSAGWHDESLIPRGGPAVEGALVVEIYTGSDDEEYSSDLAADFAQAFRNAAGRLPSSVAAQAYDAGSMVFGALALASNAKDVRTELSRKLAAFRLENGVCGPAEIDGRGSIVREAILLRVDSGEFVLHEY